MRLARLALGLVAALGGFSAALEHRDSAVISVSTSRLWLNYRHVVDEAVFEQAALNHGASPASIAAVSADATVVDLASNIAPGQAFSQYTKTEDVLERASQAHWAVHGSRTTAHSILRLLEGRQSGPIGFKAGHAASTGSWGIPMTKAARCAGNAEKQALRSLFVYLNGHGGEDFLKVHDSAIISGEDIAWALAELRARTAAESGDDLTLQGPQQQSSTCGPDKSSPSKSIDESLLVLDTCQAGSLWSPIPPSWGPVWATSPNGKSSYGRGTDQHTGVSPSDAMAGASHPKLAKSAQTLRQATMKLVIALNQTQHRTQHPLTIGSKSSISIGDLRRALPLSVMQSQLIARPTGVLASPTGVMRGIYNDTISTSGITVEQSDELAKAIGAWGRLAAGLNTDTEQRLDITMIATDLLRLFGVGVENDRSPRHTEQERIRRADARDNAVKMSELLQARPRTDLKRVRPTESALQLLQNPSDSVNRVLKEKNEQASDTSLNDFPGQAQTPGAIDSSALRLVVWMVVLSVLALLFVV